MKSRNWKVEFTRQGWIFPKPFGKPILPSIVLRRKQLNSRRYFDKSAVPSKQNYHGYAVCKRVKVFYFFWNLDY